MIELKYFQPMYPLKTSENLIKKPLQKASGGGLEVEHWLKMD